jgi:signal recognition particle GTPase
MKSSPNPWQNNEKAQFDVEEFIQSIRQIETLGPMSALMEMRRNAASMEISERENG